MSKIQKMNSLSDTCICGFVLMGNMDTSCEIQLHELGAQKYGKMSHIGKTEEIENNFQSEKTGRSLAFEYRQTDLTGTVIFLFTACLILNLVEG